MSDINDILDRLANLYKKTSEKIDISIENCDIYGASREAIDFVAKTTVITEGVENEEDKAIVEKIAEDYGKKILEKCSKIKDECLL